jgi:superoxide dismutase, Fe-Mn family
MAIQPRPLHSLAVLALLSLISVGCQGALRGTTGTEVGGNTQRKLGTLTGMELIRADTDAKVADLTNGDVIALDTIPGKPSLNVNILSTGTDINYVRITSNVPSSTSVMENTAPYALCGNKKTDFFPCGAMGPGNYTITATPYTNSTPGTPLTISFSLVTSKHKAYFLPNLTYAYNALEPYIDEATMILHHDKHHGGAVASLNKATENVTYKVPLVDLMEKALNATPIRNNGGSHYNHALFWDEMAPFDQANKTKPSEQLAALLNSSFGGLDAMKTKFTAAAAPGTLFGSGWVWLCANQAGDKLEIVGTPNQDNPLMRGVTKEIMFPILGLDVWEHAYYLKRQNRRPEYVANWWYVVDWDKVSANCAYVITNKAGVAVKG